MFFVMKKIIYTFLLLIIPFVSIAQNTTRYTKDQGDVAYSEARYSDAIEIYESILAQQGGSLSLYYNLGNAYYKAGEIGKAILNYERALRIDANDEDTKANLDFVQSKIVDKIPQDEIPFYKRWWNAFTGLFSKDSWGIIGIVAFVVMLTAMFCFYFRNDMRKLSLTVAIICLLFTVIANLSAYSINVVNDTPEAVIMDEMVFIKSSPEDSGTELTKVHEGMKVKIIDEIKDWMKIEANNGNRVVGWVKTKSLERI